MQKKKINFDKTSDTDIYASVHYTNLTFTCSIHE
jgi:hypothetical protein